MEKISGVCFEGGGAAGIAHLGALEVLEKQDKLKNVTHFVGSSAGAIAAAVMACRANVSTLKEILYQADFTSFFDDSFGIVRDTVRFVTEFGWFKGNALKAWIEQIIKDVTGAENITFQQVFEKYGSFLEVTTTDINRKHSQTVYLNHLNSPQMPIALAVYRSALIPLFFRSDYEVSVEDAGLYHYFCDGGVIDNYPLWRLSIYLPEEECLGLKLISTNEMNEMNVKHNFKDKTDLNIGQYIKLLITLLRTQALKSHVKSSEWKRTIAIDVGTVSATDFDLDDLTKEYLLQQGRDAAQGFLIK